MKPIYLGVGLAPAVTIVDGLVYVAFGVQPDGLVLVVLTVAGSEVRRLTLDAGFFNSFPRFSGPWLVYKRNGDWRPAAIHVQTGQVWIYRGQADGNFGVVVNAALNLVAYQWTSSYGIWLGSLVDGADATSSMQGAPDGLDVLVDRAHVTLRKDTRESVPGMTYPVIAGDLTVGERPDAGIAVQLEGEALRVALGGQDTPVPSDATDGDTYAIVTGGPQGVRLILASRADLLALPFASTGPIVKLPDPINDPKEIPMPVPNYERRAADFLGPRLRHFPGEEDRTREHTFGVLNALALALAKDDPNVGLLEKLGGDRVKDRAADILLIKISPTEAQVVDVIGDAEGHDGPPRPGWLVKDIRPIAQWKPPYGAVPGPPPGPEPEPGQPPAGDLADILRRLEKLEGPRQVALKTHDGKHYVCAEDAGGREVNATRTSPGPWETFTMEPK